jgi:thioredoxin-like negative regulator of GroEL
MPFGSLNSARTILRIAGDVLAARIASARGDNETAITHLRAAVATEDTLAYDEPPPWFLPSREALGAALLRAGRAPEAEQVFRTELANHPHNGRALFGLSETLKAQGKTRASLVARREFARAWQHADTRLTLADL